MARAASVTACRPLAHSRLTVTPGTVGGRPESSVGEARDVAAVLARLRHAAEDHVADFLGLDLVARDDFLDDRRRRGRPGRSGASLPAWRPMGERSPS